MKLKTLTLAIGLILTQNVFAQCVSHIAPKYTQQSLCKASVNSKKTTIDALNFIPISTDVMKVGGEVCINMGNQSVETKELFYNDKNQSVKIDTPLIYRDANQIINAKTAQIDLDKKQANMEELTYFIKSSQANGSASHLTTNDKTSQLQNLTYSTCPQDNQQWFIKAQNADIDQQSQIGTFRKMSLRFKGVPLFYFPYAKLPLNNQRLSGWLIPEIRNSSRSGFELAIPYYFNIAENTDATLIPRYITKRGAMLGAEFRYLGDNYSGELFANYLANDKETNIDRGFFEYQHRQNFSQNWSLNTRLNHVSDKQYFEDFGNNVFATSQAYLYSFMNINGFGDNWRFKAKLNDYQIISNNISLAAQPYQTLPHLDFNWFNNSNSTLNYGIDSQWDYFYKEQAITAMRLDIAPYIEKTFINRFSRFTPRLSYRYSNWNYDEEQYSNLDKLTKQRSLPIVSLDYSIYFEKQQKNGGTSSIEPRLFYLYAPYRNQQNIPLFDTHDLTFGSSLLYQNNAFTGADRQSDANQLSVGISNRHFDASGTEQWNFLLGQINYFQDRLVQLDNRIATRSTSPIITEFNYFYRHWKATASVHWDTDLNQSERALLKFQYKGKNKSLFNFAYRFRQGKIEQLDTSVVLPIGQNNRFIARWNYALDAHSTIEAIAGFEHKNCCWATRLVARRYVINEQGEMNNGLFFELQLNGLGAIGRNPRRLLKQSILGYSEEF